MSFPIVEHPMFSYAFLMRYTGKVRSGKYVSFLHRLYVYKERLNSSVREKVFLVNTFPLLYVVDLGIKHLIE